MIYYFLAIFVSWITAFGLKAYLAKEDFSLKNGLRNGGMPSQHTAAVSAITFAILFNEGFTGLFYLAFVMLVIVMTDAVNVRYNVGLQAIRLNELSKNKPSVKVVRGHTKKEVFVGLMIGLIVSYLLLFVI